MPRPSYPLFDHLTRLDLAGRRAPTISSITDAWSIDFAASSALITPRTRARARRQPEQPDRFVRHAGRARAAGGDLRAARHRDHRRRSVRRLRARRRRGGSRRPRARMRDDVLSFALGGLSKSVGLPQVKLGWMARRRAGSAASARRSSGSSWSATPICRSSTPVQVAAAELLERGAADPRADRARVQANYRRAREAVGGDAGLPRASARRRLVRGRCRCRRSSRKRISSSRLLTRDGVLAHPGYFFDFPARVVSRREPAPPPPAFDGGRRSRVLAALRLHSPARP